jgi:hypothetical protein
MTDEEKQRLERVEKAILEMATFMPEKCLYSMGDKENPYKTIDCVKTVEDILYPPKP